jgi:NAD(P)-dependent dehydrogenase (short-subunit alcohol dehydrogenase family)
LRGRLALVTGASRGIGRAVAVGLGARGATIAIHYRSNREGAEAVARAVTDAGARAHVVQADLARPEAATRLARDLVRDFGRVDVLVNNAAIQRSATVLKMEDADWEEVLTVNLGAAFRLCRGLLGPMLSEGYGRIVNVASASAFMAQRGAAAYVASKTALVGMTRVLAAEVASRGVLVNAVAPGLTDTDMVSALTAAQREALLAMVPLGRMATAEEVARVVVFVVTEATYSTGNVFHVGGGVAMPA